MKHTHIVSHTNINDAEIVNQHSDEARRIEADPAAMLALVDLILGVEPDRLPPS